MKRYAVVIEKTDTGYGAYVPDLPGCVAAGATYEETDRLIREAIPFHIEGLRRNGDPVPKPSTRVELVDAETVA
jgi:predicted RNase H-like HicB family nuclease